MCSRSVESEQKRCDNHGPAWPLPPSLPLHRDRQISRIWTGGSCWWCRWAPRSGPPCDLSSPVWSTRLRCYSWTPRFWRTLRPGHWGLPVGHSASSPPLSPSPSSRHPDWTWRWFSPRPCGRNNSTAPGLYTAGTMSPAWGENNAWSDPEETRASLCLLSSHAPKLRLVSLPFWTIHSIRSVQLWKNRFTTTTSNKDWCLTFTMLICSVFSPQSAFTQCARLAARQRAEKRGVKTLRTPSWTRSWSYPRLTKQLQEDSPSCADLPQPIVGWRILLGYTHPGDRHGSHRWVTVDDLTCRCLASLSLTPILLWDMCLFSLRINTAFFSHTHPLSRVASNHQTKIKMKSEV